VNNSGGLQLHSGFLGITEAQWLDTFQLNFHAARRMSQAALPPLLDGDGGSMVHVASESARLPSVKRGVYRSGFSGQFPRPDYVATYSFVRNDAAGNGGGVRPRRRR
jgi:NAD(P)-dependent dehydrogenase (short-subunit alcohol dehydrogenase family)